MPSCSLASLGRFKPRPGCGTAFISAPCVSPLLLEMLIGVICWTEWEGCKRNWKLLLDWEMGKSWRVCTLKQTGLHEGLTTGQYQKGTIIMRTFVSNFIFLKIFLSHCNFEIIIFWKQTRKFIIILNHESHSIVSKSKERLFLTKTAEGSQK